VEIQFATSVVVRSALAHRNWRQRNWRLQTASVMPKA